MAALNYYLGLKRGASNNPESVSSGSSTVGTAADVEVRIQINDGVNPTNITRQDVLLLMDIIEEFIAGNGQAGNGANLPGL